MLKSKRFIALLLVLATLTGWLLIGGCLGGAWETTFKWCCGTLGAIAIAYITGDSYRKSEK